MNHWVIIYRVAWGAAILLLIIVAMTFLIPKNRTLQDYQKRKGLLQQENRQTEAMVNDLKERQDRFNTDPAFVERTAREAGMVKPDEIVFRFTNASTRTPPPKILPVKAPTQPSTTTNKPGKLKPSVKKVHR